MELMGCLETEAWEEALACYETSLGLLQKPELLSLDDFYRKELPLLLKQRNPEPYITKAELSNLMQWKLSRGKWRPRLQGFVDWLEENQVETASRKGFQALPSLSKAISELTSLKGVGPACASAVLAAYAPELAPFMSDEAMMAATRGKEYTLKQYLVFALKLQEKAEELQKKGLSFTASDVERALWSSSVAQKPPRGPPSKKSTLTHVAGKRKRRSP
ncbi:DNA binding protein [Wolffia australiana]